MDHFNEWLAVKITNVVSTMWCAYAFGLIALISLPAAIHGGTPALIQWIAQTFLQLVLLSIIMVGQKVQQKQLDQHQDSHDLLHAKLNTLLNKTGGSNGHSIK